MFQHQQQAAQSHYWISPTTCMEQQWENYMC